MRTWVLCLPVLIRLAACGERLSQPETILEVASPSGRMIARLTEKKSGQGPLASAEYEIAIEGDLDAVDDSPVLRGTHSDRIRMRWHTQDVLCIFYSDLHIREFRNYWWYKESTSDTVRPHLVEVVLVRLPADVDWERLLAAEERAGGTECSRENPAMLELHN